MSEQRREPAGSPEGGQFAGQPLRESAVELDAGRGYDGSFFAVPPLSSAIELYNFFEEHPPPDVTVFKLRRLVNAHQVCLADERWNVDLASVMGDWDAQNPEPVGRGRRVDQEKLEHAARRQAAKSSILEAMRRDPRYRNFKMDAFAARVACKVIARWRASVDFSSDERRKVNQLPTYTKSLANPGSEATHEEAIEVWGLERFADEILDPEFDQRQMIEMLEKIAKEVDRQGYRISEVQNDVLNLR